MSKINRLPVRRTAAGVLAGALALSGAVAVATPASALPGFGLDRLAGENRYETSAAIAGAFGPSTGAILASGEVGRSVDALSANFLAGVQGVPVLLTQRDRIPASVLARLNALTGAKNVTIVGGTVAVSARVETQLRTAGFTVTRLGGADRYATSEEIIKAGASSASPIGLVASGTSFPDALAGSPLAYKGKHPIFLTAGSGLPQDTIDAMVAAGTRQVIILGGTAAVPASVEAQLAARNITVVTRLGGAGRSETSRIIADYLIANQGFSSTTFNVASGAPRGEGADALSGGALSGKQNRALLITDTQTQAAPVIAFATARAATLNEVGNIFGGPAAVAVALEAAIEAAGRGTGAGTGTTARPELVGAAVVSTTTSGQATASTPIGTRVRYTFDEAVTGTTASETRFFVTTSTGVRTAATAVTIEAGGTTVLARFAGIDTAAAAAALTVATVDDSAVTDGQGNVNPEGDAAIGTGGTTTGGAAGITTAPDLVSVGNFREGLVDGTTAVDFTFDEAAFVTGTAGFSLILTDGTERACVGPAAGSTTPVSGGTSAGGNGTTVITVICEDVAGSGTTTARPGTTTLAAASIARGSVAAGTVRDGALASAASDADNPLQTVDVSNSGNTTSPDLVSAEFRPGATATDADAVLYTFDEAVQTTVNAANFRVYDSSGNETGGAGSVAASAVRNPANDRQVLVTFGTAAVDNAVGASVLDGAVTAATGAATAVNQQDEVGVANATQTVTISGRTTGPDLTGVALSASGTDPFTNATNAFRAVYTFDEAVTAANTARFYLYTAEGNRLTSTTCVVGTAANSGTSTVRCTDFTGLAANGGTISGAAVGSAVLATVDAAAVTATDGLPSNPEGAEATSGGTGTANSAPTAVARPLTAPAAPVTAPTVTAASTNDADNDNTFDAAEAFTITFSRALNPAGVGTSGTTLTITDGDGTVGQVVCAADCTLNPAGTVLTIPNGGLPAATTAGSIPGFQGPLVVNPATGLVAADNGQAVTTPFNITV